jgi:hypothetical protein
MPHAKAKRWQRQSDEPLSHWAPAPVVLRRGCVDQRRPAPKGGTIAGNTALTEIQTNRRADKLLRKFSWETED